MSNSLDRLEKIVETLVTKVSEGELRDVERFTRIETLQKSITKAVTMISSSAKDSIEASNKALEYAIRVETATNSLEAKLVDKVNTVESALSEKTILMNSLNIRLHAVELINAEKRGERNAAIFGWNTGSKILVGLVVAVFTLGVVYQSFKSSILKQTPAIITSNKDGKK